MPTILVIAGVQYNNVDRPANRIRIDEWSRNLDGGYDTCSFTEVGGTPLPTWHGGQAVQVIWVDDALVAHTIFTGSIGDVSHSQSELGWMISYQAISIKHHGDRVVVTGFDLTGTLVFNRSPEDPYYTSSEAGLNVGQMIELALCIPETAQALSAAGIGNYTTLSPPTLPAATLTDLALLTIVPPQQVVLSGEGIINQLEQCLMHWMPKYAQELQPNGTLRYKDTTDTSVFVPATIILPNATLAAHPVTWPQMRTSTSRCATRLIIRGAAEIEAALLSQAEGTLAPVWTPTDESNWTLYDYTQPKDAYSEGSVVSMTSTSVVINPVNATESAALNFWSGRKAWIYLTDSVATGIEVHESRPVTGSTSYSSGGTCTITWDSAWPVASASYDTYRLIGGAGGLNSVGRLYTPREPATGDVGVDTYIGSHLVRRSQLPIRWANNSKSIDVFYATGTVGWNVDGNPLEAMVTMPATLEVLPATGQFMFTEPTVKIFGSTDDLNIGWPADASGGLPADVQVLALYSRGTLLAIVPPDISSVPQYEGTAYTNQGMEITRVIDLPSWSSKGDFARIVELAQQHLDSTKDTVHEGSFEWMGLPPWDWWDFTTCINFVIPGITGLWEAINAPIRSIKMAWNQSGMYRVMSFGFSNQRRPYSGDDLYTPVAYSGEGFLENGEALAGMQDWGMAGAWTGPQFMQDVVSQAVGAGMGGASNAIGAGMGNTSPGMSSLENFGQSLADGAGGGGWGINPGGADPVRFEGNLPAVDAAPMGEMNPEELEAFKKENA